MRHPWIDIAKEELGTKELPGKPAAKRVLEYFKAAGHGYVVSDEVAWCSAFANFCMSEAGYSGTKSLAARSWLNWGHKVDPQPGAVLIFKRGNSSWQGHVCFCLAVSGDRVTVIGGNQSNRVSIVTRSLDGLLGARMPASMGTSYKAKGGALGFAGFVGSQAGDALPYVEQAAGLPGLSQYAGVFQYIMLGLGIAGLAYMLYREWKDVSRSNEDEDD